MTLAIGEQGQIDFAGDRDRQHPGGVADGQAHLQLGMAAAVSILRLKHGSFRFSAKPIQIDKATIMCSLTLLLKDAATPKE